MHRELNIKQMAWAALAKTTASHCHPRVRVAIEHYVWTRIDV